MSSRQDLVRAIAAAHHDNRGPLMPILHDVNDELGYVSDDDVATIADALNLSRADVHGVRSFYEDFRTAPPRAHSIRVCGAEACQSLGAEALFEPAVVSKLTERGDVDHGTVFCLGNCALGPSALIDGTLVGRLTPQRLTKMTEGWRA